MIDFQLTITSPQRTAFVKQLTNSIDNVISKEKLSRACRAGAKFLVKKVKEGYKSNSLKRVTDTTIELRKSSTNKNALFDTGELMRAVQEKSGRQTKNSSTWIVGFKSGKHTPGSFGKGRGMEYGKLAAFHESGFRNKITGKKVPERPLWEQTVKKNVGKIRDVIESNLIG